MDKDKLKELIGELPGMKPPPGIISNLTNPPTKQNINLLCQITCLSLSTICVMIRMYTKIFIDRTHGWEDYSCFVAWLGLLAFSGMQLLPIFTLFPGVHQWDVKIKYLGEWGRLSNIMEIIYGPTIFLAKLSILLLYLRIFVTAKGSRTYYAIHFLIWFNLLFYLSNLPAEIWTCIPREKIWDPTIEGKCLDNDAIIVTGGVINVVSDFWILLIPLVSIGRLQMPRAKKIGVSAVFAAGFFACIASIMHLVTAIQVKGNPDKTYRLFPLALWTTAELAAGVTCSSLLTMPHFIMHVAPKIASKLSSRKTPGSGSEESRRARSTFVPKRAQSKPPPHWHDLYDTTTSGSRLDTSLELHDSHDWQSPMTTIHGGLQYLPPTEKGSREEPLVTSEEAAMEAGIMKTVRVEQYPVACA